MAFTALISSDIAVDKPITNELMTNIKDNFDYLYGMSASNQAILINPSFEIDSDSDGIPDGWTFTPLAGGSGSLSTTTPHHGERSFVFTRTSGVGNGGGELLSDYIPVTTGLSYSLGFALKQSSTQPRTKFIAQFYTNAKTTLADTTVYNSTVNPTAWSEKEYNVIPPASARYCKINIVGGATDKDFAGTIAVDNIRFDVSPYGTPVTTGTDLTLAYCTIIRYTTSTSFTIVKKTSAMTRSGDVLVSVQWVVTTGVADAKICRNGSAMTSTLSGTAAGASYTTSMQVSVGDVISVMSRCLGSTLYKPSIQAITVTANDPSILKNVDGY